MSTIQLAKVLVPPSVAAPRGAEWASTLVTGLVSTGRSLWQALERIGEARAQRELRGLAERYTHRPELAATLRNAMNRAAMQRDGGR